MVKDHCHLRTGLNWLGKHRSRSCCAFAASAPCCHPRRALRPRRQRPESKRPAKTVKRQPRHQQETSKRPPRHQETVKETTSRTPGDQETATNFRRPGQETSRTAPGSHQGNNQHAFLKALTDSEPHPECQKHSRARQNRFPQALAARAAARKCFPPRTGALRGQPAYACPGYLARSRGTPEIVSPKYCGDSSFARAKSGPCRIPIFNLVTMNHATGGAENPL